MGGYLGDFAAGATVRFKFSTNAGAGSRVDPSDAFEAADLFIYKDDSATERASASGVTITTTFDTKTGIHHVSIDLSDNADAGFFAAGSDYAIVLYPDTETVDGQAVATVLAEFSIENRFMRGTDSAYTGTPPTAAAIRTEIDANSTKLDAAVSTRATPGDLPSEPPTAAAIADQVWDEALADHAGVGSTGEALDDADATADPGAVADAVWDEAAAGHVGAGSLGKSLQDAETAAVIARKHLDNKLYLLPGDHADVQTLVPSAVAAQSYAVLYDDDSTTPIRAQRLYTKDAALTNPVLSGTGPAKRDKGVTP